MQRRCHKRTRLIWAGLLWILLLAGLMGCAMRPSGMIYTNVRFPLTTDLDRTPLPAKAPPDGRVIEVKEPFSGVGIQARVHSNAIGDIAKAHGLETLYFADQEIFSILGVWTTRKTILYGE
ncbi:TRL-like family protein [Desulfatitalea alkaliphila]|uniref:TRL-like family protein n=1 Tax=Desulfatitalea alkaliphila TaxID=2929485 RepID=A0AA41R285_9BACT|nr:TRL-like family protein [Desulfatitalea alkaliphila]MCJ8501617.1 TRL-like family protein [Desulfatitalea alkaliphila]